MGCPSSSPLSMRYFTLRFPTLLSEFAERLAVARLGLTATLLHSHPVTSFRVSVSSNYSPTPCWSLVSLLARALHRFGERRRGAAQSWSPAHTSSPVIVNSRDALAATQRTQQQSGIGSSPCFKPSRFSRSLAVSGADDQRNGVSHITFTTQ